MKNTTTTKIYKIRDSNTELFSTGGCFPDWTWEGKTWNSINHLKSHLKLWTEQNGLRIKRPLPIPDNWEIVVISITEEPTIDIVRAREFVKVDK